MPKTTDNAVFDLNSRFSYDGEKLIYYYDCETVWIEPWGKDSVRVRSTKMAEMPILDWELLPPSKTDVLIEKNDDESVSLINGKLTVNVSKRGKITFFNQKGELILSEFVRNRQDSKSEDFSALEIEPREFKAIVGGDYQLTARFESLSDKEKLYGMGQYQQPYLDLKGCELELAQRNSQVSVPFLLSSLGYGFLWNNPAVGRASFNKNVTVWEAKSTKLLDYWVTVGDTPAKIEENFAKAVGTVPMMPDYAMGFWQCKLRYQTQEELLNVARTYKKKGIPLSVIVIDFFHWPYQGEWKFDSEYWPDPDAMVKELKEMGTELMVSVWPTVDYRSENFEEMKQKGYLTRTERGLRLAKDFQGNTIDTDVTNPAARKYMWSKIKENYYSKGIKAFWLDEAEPGYSVYDFDNYRYHIGPTLQVGNIYPAMYAKTFFDGMKSEGEDEIISLIRCGWVGIQKYGALVWSGDIHSDFKAFRNQYAAGLNMGIAGIPWWNTDIGGFHGADIRDPYFHELLVRWFEYGTFCPVMRLHGSRDPFKEPMGTQRGAACPSGADNEIWSFGEEIEKICSEYIFIRERMRPYITKLMKEAHENGTPVMRTLFYEFPDDREAWEDKEEYMFGSDLLVAPVMYEGMRERSVYLPKGAVWTHVWTGEKYDGGQTVTVKAPLDQIPLFIRDSADIPIL